MDILKHGLDIVLHIDQHLQWLVDSYGTWTYIILFLIIFCETGLVVMPFLPGDSLLFAIGAVVALSKTLSIGWLFALLALAAMLGDTVNYWVGYHSARRVHEGRSRFIRKEYLARTARFYEKHGGKTIVLARFIPIIRTFAPFVAGIARMPYSRFLLYSVIGGCVWIGSLLFAGYFFGNFPIVKNNFSLVIIAVILISILPPIIEFIRHRFVPRPDTN